MAGEKKTPPRTSVSLKSQSSINAGCKKNVKAAGSHSALRIIFGFPQGVKLDWGILGMYATKPEENGFFLLLFFSLSEDLSFT